MHALILSCNANNITIISWVTDAASQIYWLSNQAYFNEQHILQKICYIINYNIIIIIKNIYNNIINNDSTSNNNNLNNIYTKIIILHKKYKTDILID